MGDDRRRLKLPRPTISGWISSDVNELSSSTSPKKTDRSSTDDTLLSPKYLRTCSRFGPRSTVVYLFFDFDFDLGLDCDRDRDRDLRRTDWRRPRSSRGSNGLKSIPESRRGPP